jgi:dipeptidyl aminopeptidase/acylaminoacyl peptidase
MSPFLAALAPALAPVPLAADAHPFAIEDLIGLDRVAELAVSPDGHTAVVSVKRADVEANALRSDLWTVDLDRGGARQLTSHEKSDRAPRFSADGQSVLFVSKRSGSAQVWRIALDGGEAEQVTALPVDVAGFEVAADGTVVASVSVFRDEATLQATADRVAAAKASPAQVRVYERLMVRQWDTWADGRQTHLVAVPPGGEPSLLTASLDGEVSGRFAITPDGRHVIFSLRPADGEAWSTTHRLYAAPLAGGEPALLTADDPAWSTAPALSPDGRTLAYKAQRTPGYESDRWQVVLRAVDADGALSVGPARWITAEWDRSVGQLAWSADGRSLLASADHLGQVGLFRISLEGRVTEVLTEGSVAEVAVAGRRAAVLINDFLHPNELFTLRPERADSLRRLTAFHDARLAQVEAGTPQQITYTGAHGDTVHAWVITPPGEAPAAGWPVALIVHGGPQGSSANRFSTRWNPQLYAAHGYAVVLPDFHGSTGYGQAFTDAIQDDWGGAPLEDVMAGLDAALAQVPNLDGERVAALGASYGGYMMFWLAGQRPDRFRCIVAHDGVFSPRALWFDTEELFFPEHDMLGTPWDNPASYARHDPSQHVDKWSTPMLVVQGEQDFRVTTSHSLGAFNALQRRGVPSRLLVFPSENHWVLGLANSARWHHEVLGWLDRWTAADAAR